jgi:putative nucleotidyltransferase with HDIG domain
VTRLEPTASLPIAPAALDHLASRFHPDGLGMFLLATNGTLLYRDAAAGLFHQRFAVPLLQFKLAGTEAVAARLAAMTAESQVEVVPLPSGVVVALVPYVERRQIVAVVGLAAKSADFRLGEDVLRTCNSLALDGTWLGQQAGQIPAYTEDAMRRKARLLLSMLRDQIKLSGLEGEVETLSTQLANTYEELSLIYQISGGMKINRSAGEFFKQACLDVLGVMEVRGVGVCVIPESLDLREPLLYGKLSLPPGHAHRLADDLQRMLRVRKTPVLINDVRADRHLAWLGDGVRSVLAVPLQRQEQVLGVLFCLDKENGEFDTVDSKLLNSIGNEAAIFIENVLLYEDVRGLMMGLLHSLTSAVDAKDAYTCGHSERVALLSKMLAQSAKLPEPLVERIYMAGLLHDVGKIGVPESVLQKCGKLTAEEFEQIKKHPEIGARILRDIRQIEDIIPGVLHHHERYDGKGYPHGLAGESIPLMGRIICLADCFDAMTSSRTYRKALPLEVALTEIRRCSGTQFDPQLADAFLSIGVDRLRDIVRSAEERLSQLTSMGAVAAPATPPPPMREVA